jgi:predicted ATP-dependent Lon-type protease
MNQDEANKIANYFRAEGLETETWISENNGGDCYHASIIDIINRGKDILKDNLLTLQSGNYCGIRMNYDDENEEDSIFLFKDYVEIRVPHKDKKD